MEKYNKIALVVTLSVLVLCSCGNRKDSYVGENVSKLPESVVFEAYGTGESFAQAKANMYKNLMHSAVVSLIGEQEFKSNETNIAQAFYSYSGAFPYLDMKKKKNKNTIRKKGADLKVGIEVPVRLKKLKNALGELKSLEGVPLETKTAEDLKKGRNGGTLFTIKLKSMKPRNFRVNKFARALNEVPNALDIATQASSKDEIKSFVVEFVGSVEELKDQLTEFVLSQKYFVNVEVVKVKNNVINLTIQ